MKKTSEYTDRYVENAKFPYNNPLMCYIYISVNGQISQLPTDMKFEEAYKLAAENGNGKIVVAFPGKWSTDAFEVDDLHEFGLAKNCISEDLPVEILGFQRSPYEECNTRFSILYDIYIKCPKGFDMYKITNFDERIDKKLHDLYGWEIAKSKGRGFKYTPGGEMLEMSVNVKNEYRWSYGSIPESERKREHGNWSNFIAEQIIH